MSKPKDGTDPKPYRLLRYYKVFNTEQIDGLPEAKPEDAEEPKEFTPVEQMEQFFSSVEFDLRHGGNSAHYHPNGD